ncbi:hypothetical protein ACM0AZ_25340 [Mycobacteroides abscessus subsp. massiliense]|uniref:hypothetical protein n=1 Tax=Mycobacteroides abscessus TaxID=36809 RepID=UPI00105534AC|nr:hypothetical protein [Mycobacteroides abscessus]MBN7567158.1 hypothetical protein [Mycobacteroides abscessus subsp. massiliense]
MTTEVLIMTADIADTIGEHRPEVSCVGPDAWESTCCCRWTSGYFYDSTDGDEARWAHDHHLALEIAKVLRDES